MRRTVRPLLAALGLGGVLVLTACTGAAPATPSPTSARTSATASTTGTTGTTTAAAPSPGATVDGSAFGADLVTALRRAGSGTATMTVSQGGTSTGITLQFALGPSGAMRAHGTVSGGLAGATGSEIVVADGATYVKLPTPLAGKTWYRSAGGGAATDPTSIATSFSGARVVYVGEEGGLRHYAVTMSGTSAGTGQAYLDGQGRPARFTGTVGAVRLDATYSGWGEPVTVTVPPASQVTGG